MLIDVREQEEWDAGHLADASLVPLSIVRKGSMSTGHRKAAAERQANLLPLPQWQASVECVEGTES